MLIFFDAGKLSSHISAAYLRALSKLAEIFYSGNHLLISSDSRIIDYELGEYILTALLGSSRRYYELESYKDMVDHYIIIDPNTERIETCTEYTKIPLDLFGDTNIYRESIILYENTNDDRIYNIIASKYIHRNGHVHLRYDAHNGAGGELGNRINYLCSRDMREKTITASIVDSDMKYKNARMGSTARGVMQAIGRLTNEQKLLNFTKIIDVHECENLIPIEILAVMTTSPMINLLLSTQDTEDWKYLDFKLGIELKRVNHPENVNEKKFYDDILQKYALGSECIRNTCQNRQLCKCKSIEGCSVDLHRLPVSELLNLNFINTELETMWLDIGKYITTVAMGTAPQAI